MPVVTVRYFAGAKAAAGVETESLEAGTLAELKEILSSRDRLKAVCLASSFLVDGQQAEPDAVLVEGAQIDVLPPFAGG